MMNPKILDDFASNKILPDTELVLKHLKVLKEMEKRIPHASVHRIENAGHYVLEEARDEVIDQIGSFLNE